MKKNPTQKCLKIEFFLAAQIAPRTKEFCFGGITPKPKIGSCKN
jgi:hypothetical protein